MKGERVSNKKCSTVDCHVTHSSRLVTPGNGTCSTACTRAHLYCACMSYLCLLVLLMHARTHFRTHISIYIRMLYSRGHTLTNFFPFVLVHVFLLTMNAPANTHRYMQTSVHIHARTLRYIHTNIDIFVPRHTQARVSITRM